MKFLLFSYETVIRAAYAPRVLKPALALSAMGVVLLAWTGTGTSRALPGRNGAILLFGWYSTPDGDAHQGLFLLKPNGSELKRLKRLARDGPLAAAWAPDGRTLALERGGIVLAQDDGRAYRRLTWGGTSPAWSPDGSQIVFVRKNGLYVVNVATRRQRRVVSVGGNSVANPDWSPDGRDIAFISARHIYAVRASGGQPRQISRERKPEPCGVGHTTEWFVSARWKPDGTEIAFATLGGCGSLPGGPFSGVGLMNTDGSNERDVIQEGTEESFPVWSPDGRFLVYSVDDPLDTRERLEINRGGRTKTILRGAWYPLDWRPLCTMRGSARADRLGGTEGVDLICGLAGNDLITGSAGADRIFGESGNDRLLARDGEFDVIGCGAGRDTVIADRADLVGRDCERVSRQ
jgi:dipeptidyl aminopeptidase/acylaminoacyl peptidase